MRPGANTRYLLIVRGKRIQQRLLVAFFGVVVAVLVPAAAMLDSWIGDSVRDIERDSLTREARTLAGELGRVAARRRGRLGRRTCSRRRG